MNCNTPCLPTDFLIKDEIKTHKLSLEKITKWFLKYKICGAEDASKFK